jgi:hypothetical protein
MYTLKNDALEVAILDPVADRARLATRYCTGGYIFSVIDPVHGNLLSSPTNPADFNTFDGQGIPDAFNLQPLTGLSSPRTEGVPVPTDGLALILGIGICDLSKNEVIEWCAWDVEAEGSSVRMTTHHAFRGYDVTLTRTVTLMERTIRSETVVSNARRPLSFRWFPHPFFPHPETDELCKFNIPVSFPENDGYAMATNGFILRKGDNWRRGYYQALDHKATTNLVVLQKHPKLGLVAATTSYIPDFFPIWGNANTFSWEPFFERSLAPRQAIAWWIDYEF